MYRRSYCPPYVIRISPAYAIEHRNSSSSVAGRPMFPIESVNIISTRPNESRVFIYRVSCGPARPIHSPNPPTRLPTHVLSHSPALPRLNPNLYLTLNYKTRHTPGRDHPKFQIPRTIERCTRGSMTTSAAFNCPRNLKFRVVAARSMATAVYKLLLRGDHS